MLLAEPSCIVRGNAMIKVVVKGDFDKLPAFLEKIRDQKHMEILEKYAKMGLDALRDATPVKTGLTASSWRYEIQNEPSKGRASIEFHNDNVNNYVNIAIILDTGHGTGTGGWVEGKHYIDPALQPVIDQLAKEAWEEVIRV